MYFVVSSGTVTDDVIAEYILKQNVAEDMKSDNFDIDTLLAPSVAEANPPPPRQ